MARRPLVAVPGRFSASASALRYGAVVNARALLEAVYAAGAEPLTVLPTALPTGLPTGPTDGRELDAVAERLDHVDAVLLPGGADLGASTYGAAPHPRADEADQVQDAFDLAAARWALATGVPLLAVCRGMQVVNVALGGTLEQHMAVPHLAVSHDVTVSAGSRLRNVAGSAFPVSCHHHQRTGRLAPDLRAVATARDGTVEAVEQTGGRGWFLGVQWHPEDDVEVNAAQQRLLDVFVHAARRS